MDNQYSPERDGSLVGFLNGETVFHGDRLVCNNNGRLIPCIAYYSKDHTIIGNSQAITTRVIDWGNGMPHRISMTSNNKYGAEDCHSFSVNTLSRSQKPINLDDEEYKNLFI